MGYNVVSKSFSYNGKEKIINIKLEKRFLFFSIKILNIYKVYFDIFDKKGQQKKGIGSANIENYRIVLGHKKRNKIKNVLYKYLENEHIIGNFRGSENIDYKKTGNKK